MFIDSSAIVALLTAEPKAAEVAAAIGKARKRVTSPIVRLEAVIAIARKLDLSLSKAEQQFDAFLVEADVEVVPITDETGRSAIAARDVYGKAPAKLNLADCLVYASAKEHRMPLLFVGGDFSHTDIKSVLANPRG
jgi:ribonuclease VapC